jgi:hypothetical protein
MAQRINEDIRFYLPADPYYYEVDNLPLEDLLANDVRLQSQIDSINSAETGNTVGRAGFTELQPFIDTGLPGTVSVRPGNFIGRVQSSAGAGLAGGAEGINAGFNGLWEVDDPPTTFGTGDNPTGTYSVGNPPDFWTNPGDWVGRTALFNFIGGNISIDAFDFDSFQFPEEYPHDGNYNTTPPQGRIDLIGITTMNGAMDDVWLPGNAIAPGVEVGDGTPRLAVVKGAGIVPDLARRQVVIGEKFLTVGLPQENLNDYGRNFEGDVVPNPEFGTVPGPDDAVNANFARDIMANGAIAQTLTEWAASNKNASFFLPVAYVYVPQSHVEGAPIPQQYLRDIRPFFRTAELAQTERQAIAASVAPSNKNPFVTESHAKAISLPITQNLEQEISDLKNILRDTKVRTEHTVGARRVSNLNNVRTSKGWTKVTPADTRLGFGNTLPPNTVAIRVFFFAFMSGPDSSPSQTYLHAAGYNPDVESVPGILNGRVLAGRSAGSGDHVGFGNTCIVPVDPDGNWYYKIDGNGYNTGAYADVQGYVTEKSILD